MRQKMLFFILLFCFSFILKAQKALNYNDNYSYSKNNSVLITTPNDPGFQYQWGLNIIQAPQAWDINRGNSNMIIGILDSGIPLVNGVVTHEDFDANRIIIGNDYLNDNYGIKDRFGHGTFIAGIIGAKTNNNLGLSGINWNSKLYINQVATDIWGTVMPYRFANGLIDAVNR